MKNLPFKLLSVTFVVALLVTSVVQAQQRDNRQGQPGQRGQHGFGGFGGPRVAGGNLLFLLRVEEVRKEIRLDEIQVELVKAVEEEVHSNQPPQRFNFREATEKEREKYFAERRARVEKDAKATKKMLATVLSKDQMKRLTEISIQQQGTGILNDSDVAEQLNITAEQKERIAETQQASSEELRSKMREFFQGGNRGGNRRGFEGENFEEIRKKLTELRAKAVKNVLAVLTPEQQKQFDAMKGKKFEMPRRPFGGRGVFGGGRRQGRPDGGDRSKRPQRPGSDQ